MPPTGSSWIAVALAFRLLSGLEDGLPDGWDADRPGPGDPRQSGPGTDASPGSSSGVRDLRQAAIPGTSQWTRPVRSRLAEAREGAVARPSAPCYRAPVTLSDTGG
jgi:hypothetical protein